jgi:hypothetical protein
MTLDALLVPSGNDAFELIVEIGDPLERLPIHVSSSL